MIPPRPGSRHLIIPRSASRAAPSIGAKGVVPSRDWPFRKRRVCHSAAQKRLFSVRAGIVSPPAPACGLSRCAYSFLIRNKEVRILSVPPLPLPGSDAIEIHMYILGSRKSESGSRPSPLCSNWTSPWEMLRIAITGKKAAEAGPDPLGREAVARWWRADGANHGAGGLLRGWSRDPLRRSPWSRKEVNHHAAGELFRNATVGGNEAQPGPVSQV